jgi:hypothetical protein
LIGQLVPEHSFEADREHQIVHGGAALCFHTNIIPGSADPSRYMAIYDIETDDIGAALAAMGELAASGRMPLPDSMAQLMIGAVYEEFGEAVRPR